MSSFFFANVQRGKKHIPLAPNLDSNRTIEILHSHTFLVQYIWPKSTIKTTATTTTSSTFTVETETLTFKATLTNITNGVSVREEGLLGFTFLVCWIVRESPVFLEENVSVECFSPLARFAKIADDFNPKTKHLIEMLDGVACGDISMDDIKSAHTGHTGTGKLKNG